MCLSSTDVVKRGRWLLFPPVKRGIMDSPLDLRWLGGGWGRAAGLGRWRGGWQATILPPAPLSILLGWSRAVMHKTFSVLSFLILTLERADFSFCFSWVSLLLLLLSLLFCLHLSAFLSVAGFFSSKPGIYDAERKPRELTTVSFLRF